MSSTEAQSFRVGDRVRVKDDAPTHAGQRGIVVRVPTWAHPYPSKPSPRPDRRGVIVLVVNDERSHVYLWHHELAAVDAGPGTPDGEEGK